MGNQKDTESRTEPALIDKKHEDKPVIDDDDDNSYSSWLSNHPSALENFEDMISKAKGKDIVVFLDYDGTLSNIVPVPDLAFATPEMIHALCKTAYSFPTAIVSGRRPEKVFNFVQLKHCFYAGSHGMDIATPRGSRKHRNDKRQIKTVDEKGNSAFLFHPAKDFVPKLKKLKRALRAIARGIEGSMVEDNRFCLSVHYRRVPTEKNVNTLKKKVEHLMKRYPDFHISSGKMVMEVRPSIDWDKGRALEYLLDTFGFDVSDENLYPMYIGDDKTDEDAFATIHKIGRGFPIVVSSTRRDTSAEHSLKDPSEVMAFLIELVKWKQTWAPTPSNDSDA